MAAFTASGCRCELVSGNVTNVIGAIDRQRKLVNFSSKFKPALTGFQGLSVARSESWRHSYKKSASSNSLSTTAQLSSDDESQIDFDASSERNKKSNDLFSPYKMGNFELQNRIVLAPLTRSRALGTVPQPAAAEYYSLRAKWAGLLISEATCVAPEAHGYVETPGIYKQEQVDAWRPIVDAVHEHSAPFFLQLWHVGRASHPDFQPGGAAPVSPTSRGISVGSITTPRGTFDFSASPPPRALDASELPQIVDEFRKGARNAVLAGFDGVEIHGAHGYLIDQFLKDGVNDRSDEYGGSVEKRARFPLEVVRAVVDEVGAGRVGIRLSPFADFLDARDSDPVGTFSYMVAELQKLGLLYIHMVVPRVSGEEDADASNASLEPFRKIFSGTLIAAGGYDLENATRAVASGQADLIAFGRLFISNPDLPRRLALGAPLNAYDRSTFYTQDQRKGYLDYPELGERQVAELERGRAR
eukprot:jgi/Mesen1/7125/ME000369S06454